jgi:hypothetical protein
VIARRPKDEVRSVRCGRDNLGVSYVYSGNRTAALDAVRELRRLDPEMAEKLFNLIVPP